MSAPMSVANAAANGDLTLLKQTLRQGANVNERSKDGMSPLALAAFWGYADVVECLLNHGADVNICNKGTQWTALHCAAFQGHGKVIMKLMEHNPNTELKDNQGRTAVDFASAMDAIWPFFAAAGCKRTPKSELIRMDIVKRVTHVDPTLPKSEIAHFSRPGSAYVIKSQPLHGNNPTDTNMAVASMNGDVLAGLPEEPEVPSSRTPQINLAVFNNM
ncbi:ankyrin repeat domain-containing protein 49-like isoform X1 [Saccostrea cucullata]|uniref:ankyrin repeat domain-containing protein 49-like isoform X1 n=2 Tax=Saccostrea cuccullata TaxID=36930 RepID=UPI002ED20473